MSKKNDNNRKKTDKSATTCSYDNTKKINISKLEKSAHNTIRGLYVSADGNIDIKNNYVVGTMKNFNKLLMGDENKECSYDLLKPLNDDYKILYNTNSTEYRNKFVSRYVDHSIINGPIIFIKGKGNIELDAHKTLGKNVLSKNEYLGFTL